MSNAGVTAVHKPNTSGAAPNACSGSPAELEACPGACSSSALDFKQRSSVLGMPIWAFDCVPDAAVCRLVAVVGAALAHAPPQLLERMRAAGSSFALIGRDQVVSDVPAHRFMRHNEGRDLDATARGLGGTPTVPVTSVGEENVTMEGDRMYPCQSILIHELGHAVHNLGLDETTIAAVYEAYSHAVQAKLYPEGCYMTMNEQEYWAVGVESWFESTIRKDVNGGVRTRAALRRHDPLLAALLQGAFGDGPWRYHHDCPRPLAMPQYPGHSSEEEKGQEVKVDGVQEPWEQEGQEGHAAVAAPGALEMDAHRASTSSSAGGSGRWSSAGSCGVACCGLGAFGYIPMPPPRPVARRALPPHGIPDGCSSSCGRMGVHGSGCACCESCCCRLCPCRCDLRHGCGLRGALAACWPWAGRALRGRRSKPDIESE